MSSQKAFPKKAFRSKTAVTNCGYCSQKIKEENLENHCKTVHKKPKLVAGQKTLDLLFSRLGVATGGGSSTLLDPDPSPPASKKAKLSQDDLVICFQGDGGCADEGGSDRAGGGLRQGEHGGSGSS